MPTVQQTTEAIYRLLIDDQASAGAEAAAASIDKANAAMDRGDVSVQKAAVRTSTILKQWDDQAKAAANLQRVLAQLGVG